MATIDSRTMTSKNAAGQAGKNRWDLIKATLYLRTFGLLKVPMLWWLKPQVVRFDSEVCEIMIPFSRRSKNHLNALYFGALCAGADCAGGFAAMTTIQKEAKDVRLVFKDFKAEFMKRADGNTVFRFKDIVAVKDLVRRAQLTGEREEMPLHIEAFVPKKYGDEPVAKFVLTLSLKRKA